MNNHQRLYEKLGKLDVLMHRYYGHGIGGSRYAHRGQGRVLTMLWEKKEISQKELGALLDMRKQSLGELLHKLEMKGLIERQRLEDDRRSVIVKITDSGLERAENMVRETNDRKDVFSLLSEEERSSFESSVQRLIEVLEREWGEMTEEEQMQYRKKHHGHHSHAQSHYPSHRREFGKNCKEHHENHSKS